MMQLFQTDAMTHGELCGTNDGVSTSALTPYHISHQKIRELLGFLVKNKTNNLFLIG